MIRCNRSMNNVFTVSVIGLLCLATAISAETADENLPHLRKQGSATQLIVDGKPFMMIAGELGNSSSDKAYMKRIWPRLREMNLNTVLAPVYWDVIEPNEGEFDFTMMDDLIKGARKHDMRLVLLWFGSWKNSMSCYVPAWIKTDDRRFPRARLKSGQAMEIISPFSSNNLNADINAFTALMKHIRKMDEKKHTVIMIQVENEVGMLTDARDYSEAANTAFDQNIPAELAEYLRHNKDTLIPELQEVWLSAGNKTSGCWQEVFGKSLEADEIFMAWHFAAYINQIARAGKEIYPLPMYVNAALPRPQARPGEYPSAGPLPHLLDIWRAGGPSLDFISPDIYAPEFIAWCQKYHQSGNPLFIPEARLNASCSAKALYSVAEHNAMGFSPFSIESAEGDALAIISQSYDLLRQMSGVILKHQGRETMAGVLLDKENQVREIELGNYLLKVSHDFTWSWSSGSADDPTWPQAGGIIISVGPDEYIIAGSGIIVTFKPSTTNKGHAGIVSIQEGKYIKGKWVPGRWLNGDQSHQGRHLRLTPGSFGIQHIKLYTYN
ncbi:MAG: DUF5597 domain-containing protein [Sedimentisphaerales bacterium]|nr:DUF5597 domain-containing protein [Sedimentisphaerales bacterium]